MPTVRRRRRKSNGLVEKGVLIWFLMTITVTLFLANVLFFGRLNDTVHPDHNMPLQTTVINTTQWHGKEPLLKMLKDAEYEHISQESIEQLPTWEEVKGLLGDQPKIVGLESCPKFRASVDAKKRLLAPAGPFNSGTNVLAELLWANCKLPELKRKYNKFSIRWQVNWGKHHPARIRLKHRNYKRILDNSVFLPVVTIRDPYTWMQSMCRRAYAADWYYWDEHCPNLVANDVDFTMLAKEAMNDDVAISMANTIHNTHIVPVQVEYKEITMNHESLAHMWNEWYDEYLQADFPRIFVRMEDLVFFPQVVVDSLCECVGGVRKHEEFWYQADNAKEDSPEEGQYATTLLDAMIRYGRNLNRTKGMSKDDLDFAKTTFRQDLMDMFGYTHPQE